MDGISRSLSHCRLFKLLSVEEISELLPKITYSIKSYKKNEVIFSPHQASNYLGIILTGSVDVQKIFASGKAITVNRRFRMELIADASLFAGIEHYPSTISACENCQILLINKNALLKLFSLDERIMINFLECVSNKVLGLNNTIEILSLSSVPSKIAYFLILEKKKQKSNTITLQFSKKSLAEHLNVSRPTLSRELQKMQQTGIISFQKRTIKILNIEGLEELCSI